MADINDIETFWPQSVQEWRDWLDMHHDKKLSVWVVQCKKETGLPTISWSEAVDMALCYGWIDSTRKTIEGGKFIQFFTRRKPKSAWSKINKEKIERLTTEGLMMPAGQDVVARAKKNGTWTILDEVEELTVPKDLEAALSSNPVAQAYFASQSKSVKKMMLHWLVMAKRAETRQKRIAELVDHAGRQTRPKQIG